MHSSLRNYSKSSQTLILSGVVVPVTVMELLKYIHLLAHRFEKELIVHWAFSLEWSHIHDDENKWYCRVFCSLCTIMLWHNEGHSVSSLKEAPMGSNVVESQWGPSDHMSRYAFLYLVLEKEVKNHWDYNLEWSHGCNPSDENSGLWCLNAWRNQIYWAL